MSETIEVESIRRLDVKPGETLVVTVPDDLTEQEIHDTRDALLKNLPDGVAAIVMNRDVELSVVSSVEVSR